VGNFSALLDACVIFPFSLSNLLLEAAYKELYRVNFSTTILDEAIRNRVKRGRMNQVAADKFRAALIRGFPHALVEAPVDLEGKMENHPGDRHVLASAVYAKVDVIVTSNLKHFSPSSLAPWGFRLLHNFAQVFDRAYAFLAVSKVQLQYVTIYPFPNPTAEKKRQVSPFWVNYQDGKICLDNYVAPDDVQPGTPQQVG
jgi:predicted nucleic acid-binding protein